MSWKLVFTRQAQRDAKKLQAAGLRPRAEKLLNLLRENPFCTPPPFEKLLGDASGAYARRINIQHRLVLSGLTKRKSRQGAPPVDPL